MVAGAALIGSIVAALVGQFFWSALAFGVVGGSVSGAVWFARDRRDWPGPALPPMDPQARSVRQAWRRIDDEGLRLYMAHTLGLKGRAVMATTVLPPVLTGGFVFLWAVTEEYVAATWTLLAGLWVSRAGLRIGWHFANEVTLGRRVPAPRVGWWISFVFAVGATAGSAWFLHLSSRGDVAGESAAIAIGLMASVVCVVHLLTTRGRRPRRPTPGRAA